MARAWHLVSRPAGLPTAANFALRDLPAHDLAEGEIRVANRWLSVDPYMRGRMNDTKSYISGFTPGRPMSGGAVGQVIESRSPGFSPGDWVLHMDGWRDEAAFAPDFATMKLPAALIDGGMPPQTFLHNMGLTGGTAWVGLLKVAEAKPGDVVFVSAAAGAVGSAVVQIAKARGMTVIGSAGGAEKVAWVRSLGADAAIDYKAGPVLRQLSEALEQAGAKGIDVYFDNVGGEHLDAAFATASDFARFAICGMIGSYNDARPVELRHLIRTIPARIRMQGFIYTDYMADLPAFAADMAALIAGGKVVAHETVHDGLESTANAFLALFSGGNRGKMLVRV